MSGGIPGSEARRLVHAGALLLDVRTQEEYTGEGHLPGAVNIPVQELGDRLGELPNDRAIVVYCRSGSRSARAAGILRSAGRTRVFDLGSLDNW